MSSAAVIQPATYGFSRQPTAAVNTVFILIKLAIAYLHFLTGHVKIMHVYAYVRRWFVIETFFKFMEFVQGKASCYSSQYH